MDTIVYDKVGQEAEKVRNALYGIYPQATITDAAIASFDDGADGIPVKALTVGIEPVQNLYGYDYPWPAGGGKNLADFVDNKNITEAGVVIDSSGRIATVDPITIEDGVTYIAKNLGAAVTGVIIAVWNGNTMIRRVTQEFDTPLNTDGGDRFYICVYHSAVVTVESAKVMVVKSTETVTTYSPYSNICPITGWTGAKVMRTGKNLLSPNYNGYSLRNGYLCRIGVVPPNTLARFTFKNKDTTIDVSNLNIGFVDNSILTGKPQKYRWAVSNGIIQGDATNIATAGSILCPNIIIYPSTQETFDKLFARWDIMVELGNTATEYDPYQGQTYDITFPSEAGTVYGGTLDVTSGTLIVDRAKKIFDGTEYLNISLDNAFGYAMYTLGDKDSVIANSGISNILKAVTSGVNQSNWSQHVQNSTAYNRAQIAFRFTSEFQDGTETGTRNLYSAELLRLYQSGTPLEVVYKLAAPITYTLTAEQVRTLLGENHIWADTGNIKKLTYRADLGKYIDSHITTAVANALNA